MIDKNLFSVEVTILSEWFNKPMSEAVMQRLWEVLSDELDNESFALACRVAFSECKFFPTPKELISFGTGLPSSDGMAAIEWEIVLSAASGNSDAISKLEGLSDYGTYALKVLGGINRIGDADPKNNNWLKKEFIQYWKEAMALQQRRKLTEGAIATLPVKSNGFSKIGELLPVLTQGDETNGW